MRSGFNVFEFVLKGDEHLLFNLTVLKALNDIGLLKSFNSSSDLRSLYVNYWNELGDIPVFEDDVSRRLYLTGSWKLLFHSLFNRKRKVIFFHNFFGFIDHKSSLKRNLMLVVYRGLLHLGRVTPVVLNDFIADTVSKVTGYKHMTVQLVYNECFVSSYTNCIDVQEKVAIFGNLYPGKVDENILAKYQPKHFGKLYGGMVYSNSIDEYLDFEHYYKFMRSVESLLLLNNYNHRVASGVFADSIMLRKQVICIRDNFTSYFLSKYNVEFLRDGDFIVFRTDYLQQIIFKEMLKNLSEL